MKTDAAVLRGWWRCLFLGREDDDRCLTHHRNCTHPPQRVLPSYTCLNYSKMTALKTLTLDVECSKIWVHAFNEECIRFINDYVRMTRTDWCNLSGYKCSIPEREHSMIPHKTHRWTMLKNRLLHTSLSSNPATHTALHNTHRSRVLGIYTWSFHALLLIRHTNFTRKYISILKLVWDTWNRSQQYYFHIKWRNQ